MFKKDRIYFPNLLLAAVLVLISGFNPKPFAAQDDLVNVIVIDPGHGGNDPGNLGTGRYKRTEKDIALEVSKLIKGYIEDLLPGTKVILTRSTDKRIPLYQRAKIANDANADLFISIHCNAVDAKSAYGTETFVLGMGEKDQRLNRAAQMENASMLLEENWEENYEDFDPNNPATAIALRAYQDAFLEQSIQLANSIEGQFKERAKRRSRGVKQQPLAVLRGSTMPAVLVELGFLSNPKEEDFVQSKNGKELLASGIYRAVKEYKIKRESKLDNGDAFVDIGDSTQNNNDTTQEATESQSTSVGQEDPQEVEESATGIVFSVQIAVSRNDLELLPQNFLGLEGVYKKEVYGLYKYYYGRATSYAEAQKLLAIAKEKYADAYLVAFDKGRNIDLAEAKALAP